MFKVFVYSKKTNKRVGIFTHVIAVMDCPADGTIDIYTAENECTSFDVKTYKTTIYQN